jgi:intracellular sulfur oxidation DsrE/DsrF family protein
MKDILFFSIFILFYTSVFSQEAKPSKGSIIENFGQIYSVQNPDLLLDKNKKYKVIFDIYSDVKSNKKMNTSINTVARFINMHAEQGIPLENLDIALVLHGEATKNALSDAAYMKKFKVNNPNNELLKALEKTKVEMYVCGQSFMHHGYRNMDLNENVQLALSALTALTYYQTEGYQLITFN